MNIAQIDLPVIAPELGQIRQIAYIVEDLDSAMKTWQQQRGVQAFVVARNAQPLSNASYRGQAKHRVTIDVAFGYLGDLQIELIELKGDTPSMYKEALDRHQKDLQHYGVTVEDFDRSYEYALNNGFESIVDSGVKGLARMSYVEAVDFQQTVFAEQDREFMYTPEGHGIVLEIIEWNAMTRPYFERIRELVDAVPPGVLFEEFNLNSITPVAELLRSLPGFLWKKLTFQL